jgi:hypothetical protein
MKFEVLKKEQHMPIYWEKSANGIQETNFP